MSISKYEALALYHYVTAKEKGLKKYLILDLDDCSFGYCSCTGENTVQMERTAAVAGNNIWDECVRLTGSLLKQRPVSLDQEMDRQILSAEKAFLQYFLSEKEVDKEAFALNGESLSCGKLDQAYSEIRMILEDLYKEMQKSIPEEEMENMSILLLGKAKQFFAVEYYIRELFSYDPLLPDGRFLKPESSIPVSEMVEQGKEFHERQKKLKHTYTVMAFDAEKGTVMPLYFMSPNQVDDAGEKTAWSESMYVAAGDRLLLRVDQKDREIPLPYSFAPAEYDLIEVAIGLEKGQDTLYIRRSLFPTRVYKVGLSEAE